MQIVPKNSELINRKDLVQLASTIDTLLKNLKKGDLQDLKNKQGFFRRNVKAANYIVKTLQYNNLQLFKKGLKLQSDFLKKRATFDESKEECELLAENTCDLYTSICFEEAQLFIPQKGGRGKTTHIEREVYDNRSYFKDIDSYDKLHKAIDHTKQVKNTKYVTPRLIREVRENNKSNYRAKAKSGHPEYYTPPKIIEMARKTMGSIDTDPASCAIAQKNVKAKTYFIKNQDGLTKVWTGNVWMNPPFTYGVIDSFIDKLQVKSYKQAIVITNNNTETRWGQKLLQLSNCVCFPKGRVKFWDKDGEYPKSPVQGQMIFGIRVDTTKFKENFSTLGQVIFKN